MNRKTATVVLGVSLAAVLAVSYILYSHLTPSYHTASSVAGPSSGVSSTSSTAENRNSSAAPTSEQSSESAAPAAVLAPDFTVYDASGKAVKLSEFRGKPVVLNFWASWCGYCKEEMPEFNEAYKKYQSSVQFLFVDWTDGSRETQSEGAAFLKSEGYSFPAYYDLKQNAVTAYELTGIPATFYIDRQGRLAGGGIGITTKEKLEQGIASIR